MQKKGSVTVFHLVMMFLMMFGTIGGAVKFIIDAVGSETSSALLSNITNIVLMAVIFSMLMMGAVYIIKDYSKPVNYRQSGLLYGESVDDRHLHPVWF